MRFDTELSDVLASAHKLGLGGRRCDVTEDDVLRVRPPRAQASFGATVDFRDGTVLVGEKGDMWTVNLDIALALYREFEEMDLTWEWLTPGRAHRLCRDLRLQYLPLLRLDGSPKKPRIIHAGHSAMYAIESAISKQMDPEFKATTGFAYRVENTYRRFEHLSDHRFINCDFSNYDAHQYWGYMKLLYQALGDLYSIPDWLMVPVCAYNMGAPIWLPEVRRSSHGIWPFCPTGKIRLVYVAGKARSGSGIFPKVNSLGSFVALDYVGQKFGLDESLFGQTFGDNSVWPTPSGVGAREWADLLRVHFGFKLKPEESVISRGEVSMLRRIINLETGMIEPLIGSRARNALFPRIQVPDEAPPELVAIMYRAQTAEILLALQEEPKYRRVLEYWLRNICPNERFLWNFTDLELQEALPHWAADYDALTWVKIQRGVVDTTDIAH